MQQIIETARVIEHAGFTVYDDLMHGFGAATFRPCSDRKAARPGRFRK